MIRENVSLISAVETLTPPVNEQDHVCGPASAMITLVEYGDFECPYCGTAYWVIKEVQRQLGDDLRIALRHFPLPQHPHAFQAAEAAEAAGAQGKFWEMHDMLFEHRDHLDMGALGAYAGALGVDMEAFLRDMRRHAHSAKIAADAESGLQSGVEGTPSFFINGMLYRGPVEADLLVRTMRQIVAA